MSKRSRQGPVLEPVEKHIQLNEEASDQDDRCQEKRRERKKCVRTGKKDDGPRGACNADEHNNQNGRNHKPLSLEDIEPESLYFLEPLYEILRFLQRFKRQESHKPAQHGVFSVWGRQRDLPSVRDNKHTKLRTTMLRIFPNLPNGEELLWYSDASTTMLYTDVLGRGGLAVVSPFGAD